MRARTWVLVGMALAGPVAGQVPWDFNRAIDFIRSAGPIIAYANQCLRDPNRIIRTKDNAVKLASYGRTEDERLLIEAAMSIELLYLAADRPKLETCPDWIERFLAIERAVDFSR